MFYVFTIFSAGKHDADDVWHSAEVYWLMALQNNVSFYSTPVTDIYTWN